MCGVYPQITLFTNLSIRRLINRELYLENLPDHFMKMRSRLMDNRGFGEIIPGFL